MTALFASEVRDHWRELLEGTDACFAPVLSLKEASDHPHNVARNNFVVLDGHSQPSPAPKFSKTPMQAGKVPVAGQHTGEIMQEAGLYADKIAALLNQ